MKRRTFVQASSVLGMAALPGWARRPFWSGGMPSASILLKGGLVYDGTGAPPVEADVAVDGDRISGIGPGLAEAGAAVIDIKGLAVAPGFIDIHSHTDRELLVNPRAESKIRQGVTTEIVGQDGSSLGPWRDTGERETSEEIVDIAGFFERLERDGTAVNIASMIGAGTIRGLVIGEDDRPATAEELAQMVALVAEAIEQGACGLSSGLEYVPGGFADLDELVALAEPLRGTGLPYASHIRNEDDQLMAAIEEALAVGRRAGVPVHISHLKAQGQRNWWKAEPVLHTLERAAEDGDEVTFDRYPYVAYSTGLTSLFPLWSRDGGTEAFLVRLDDAELQEAIEKAVRGKVAELGSWDAVQMTSADGEGLDWIKGRKVGALAQEVGKDPYLLLLEIVRQGQARIGMVGFGMSEENTAMILAHPLGMICSDGSARATYGPLSEGSPHPRSYGAFPRVLGHYCRDQHLMPLEVGIHKMTGMPARRLRLDHRGRVAVGAFADLVVFDPATVADRATFTDPHQYPVGIDVVLVNGEVVIREGEHTGALPGRTLRIGF
ncbi:MAG: D-aminoacylase [Gemmatimonadetes bacterium]|nr:MAG: D-aminoacylase [Gemmatimonadota bacterium]